MSYVEIKAENGKGFQEYKYVDGTPVPTGTPIGKEILIDGQWKFKLYDGIFFSDESRDEYIQLISVLLCGLAAVMLFIGIFAFYLGVIAVFHPEWYIINTHFLK